MLQTDFSLLVGLSVALAVFLVVTATSIKILRGKGRSPSMYTMANLNYRRDLDRSNGGTGGCGASVAPVSGSSSTSAGCASSSTGAASDSKQHQLHELTANGDLAKQTETRLTDGGMAKTTLLPSSAANGVIRYENMAALSQGNSPFVDKRGRPLAVGGNGVKAPHLASALTLTSNLLDSPLQQQVKASTLSAAGPAGNDDDVEHQYDIPFSHLTPGGVRTAAAKVAAAKVAAASASSTPQVRLLGRARAHRRMATSAQSLSSSSGPDYDEMDEQPRSKQQQFSSFPNPPSQPKPKRRSQGSNRTSSGTNGSGGGNNTGADLSGVGVGVVGGAWRSDGSLLQPRLIDPTTGFSPMKAGSGGVAAVAAGGWSGSEKSLSIFSESSHPVSSAAFDPSGLNAAPVSSVYPASADRRQQQFNRLSITSDASTLDPDSFAFAQVTSAGGSVSLPCHGVRLVVPEGALDPGTTEDVFLAVMTEGRDRPRLSPNQTLLSPVVLAGPPGLALRKPSVLTFDHCADLQRGSWEIGVYHCDSLLADGTAAAAGADGDDSPWVKLVTVGQETSSPAPILACMDLRSCHVLSDFLTRFCVVGQSTSNSDPQGGARACKSVRVLLHGRPVSSSGADFTLLAQVVEDLQSSLDRARRHAERHGYRPLSDLSDQCDRPLAFYDNGDDLVLSLGDCASGWSLRPKTQQTFAFDEVWSSASAATSGQAASPSFSFPLQATYSLRHVDPTVSSFAFKLSAFQSTRTDTCLSFQVEVDAAASGLSPLSLRISPRTGTTSSSGSGGRGRIAGDDAVVKIMSLPGPARARLCSMLDSPMPGQNDWRALSAGLRLERFTGFFSARSSPAEAVLLLWEAQVSAAASAASDPQQARLSAAADLLNLLRVIGRQDCAQLVEAEYGPWM